MTADAVNTRQKLATDLYPDISFFEPYYHGSTYVSLEDAILTLKEFGTEQLIKMTWDLERDNRTNNDVLSKRNWPTHIMVCQRFDKNIYVTPFPKHHRLVVILQTHN